MVTVNIALKDTMKLDILGKALPTDGIYSSSRADANAKYDISCSWNGINCNYKWNIAQPRNYFICNAPSLFCEQCLYWKNVIGFRIHKTQNMYTNGTLLQNAIVSNVQWINKNGIISIEYMFK